MLGVDDVMISGGTASAALDTETQLERTNC
jgi:hypothetical protein